MSDANNKLINSAHQLGVMLGIPMYVDPEKGFNAEKVLTWENGDKIKVEVNWADGAFYFTAYLGQIDPKTNEMSFISGSIAQANSLESLIGMIDGFVKEKAVERGETETVLNPEITEPVAEVPADDVSDEEVPVDGPVVLDIVTPNEIGIVNDLPSDVESDEGSDEEVDIADEIIKDYQDEYKKYQDLLMDPDHDHSSVYEMSQKLQTLETKLREQGINPTFINKD